jgi:hypothetical protein
MQFGRKAYGAHRRMSNKVVARNIAESIRQHAAAGRVRTVEQYTQDRETQALVAALLQQAA